MKIVKIWMTTLFACVALQTQGYFGILARAISERDNTLPAPFRFGLKVGGSISRFWNYRRISNYYEEKFGSGLEQKGLNPWVVINVYLESAYHNYFGWGLEIGYLKQAATLQAEGELNYSSPSEIAKDYSLLYTAHCLAMVAGNYIYPLGYRYKPEMGLPKLFVGLAWIVPMDAVIVEEYSNKVKKAKVDITTDWLFPLVGLAYEHPLGLLFELRYALGLCSRTRDSGPYYHRLPSDTSEQVGRGPLNTCIDKGGEGDAKIWSCAFTVGYNLLHAFQKVGCENL